MSPLFVGGPVTRGETSALPNTGPMHGFARLLRPAPWRRLYPPSPRANRDGARVHAAFQRLQWLFVLVLFFTASAWGRTEPAGADIDWERLASRADLFELSPGPEADSLAAARHESVHSPSPDLAGPLAALVVASEDPAPTGDRPDERAAYVARVRASAAVGAASRAVELAQARPDWFAPEELARYRQDAVARDIRHGVIARDVASGPERFALLDSTLATLDRLLDEPVDATRQAYDRLVALREREAFAEVLAMAPTLPQPLPDYVRIAIADAHLARREPARAARLYREAIGDRRGPGTWDWRIAHAYALLESNRARDALQGIETLQADVVAAALAGRGGPDAREAVAWVDRIAVVKANFARLASRHDASERVLADALDEIPFDLDLRTSRIELLVEREQPRIALTEARRVRLDHPDAAWPGIAEAQARISLSDYGGARDTIDTLRATHGDSPATARVARQLERRRTGAVRVAFDANRTPDTGGEPADRKATEHTRRLDLTSPVLADRYRLLAGTSRRTGTSVGASAGGTGGADAVTVRRRDHAGLRLERPDLELTLLATVDPALDRPGGQARAIVAIDDALRIVARVEKDADAVPLAALREGLRLDLQDLGLEWRDRERRVVSFDLGAGRFSDGNTLARARLAWTERRIAGSADGTGAGIDLTGAIAHARFARQDVAYFSPAGDTTASIAITGTDVIRRAYDSVWQHSLTIEPTLNRQAGQATRPGLHLRYAHEWEVDASWGGRAALDFNRRPYDGLQENRWAAALELFRRF